MASYRLVLDEKLIGETLDRIDEEVQKGTNYISVTGGPGCGKTTLASAWLKRHIDRSANPRWAVTWSRSRLVCVKIWG